MTSLYPIGSVYIAVNSALEDPNLTEEQVQELVNRQVENELVAQERAVMIAHDVKSLEAWVEMVEGEIKNLKSKIERAERARDSILKGVSSFMNLKQQDKLEAGPYTFSFRKSTTCDIIDESKVPGEFKTVETVVKIDKNALKRAAKDGAAVEFVDGFQLSEHKNLNLK